MKPTLSSTGMIPFLAITGATTEDEVRAKVTAIQTNGTVASAELTP
jgi:hypothetical protein